MKRSKTALLLVTLAVCIAAALTAVACSSKSSLKLDRETAQLYVNGSNAILRATLDPADKSAQYEWSVDNDKIVKITARQSTCTVAPLAEGDATVTVKVGDKTATCKINVGADQHKQLKAPSFTYDGASGVITITDSENNASDVGGYELRFYDAGGEQKGAVVVKNGDVVDTRRIDKGEYTVRLVALGDGNLWLESDPSAATASINVTVDKLYELLDSKTIATAEGAGKWGYYIGGWAVYVEGYHYDGVTTFEFKNNDVTTKDYWYMTQLQYNHGNIEAGKLYKMPLKIKSPAEGKVTINNKIVMLHEGDNFVTVGLTSSVNDGLFKMTFAVSDGSSFIKEGRFEISIDGEIEETEPQKLATPSFEYDRDTKIITITDNQNNVNDVNYTLGFFKNKDDATPMGTAVVTDGNEVDFSGVVSGNYYLKLLAATAGLPYTDSDWSEVTDYSVVVANSRVDVVSGGQGVSASNPNKWYEWHDSKGGQGSPVATVLEYAYQDDAGVFYLKYNAAGENQTAQPIKLHYNDSNINEGDVYEFNCIVVSPMDGKITVNGKIFAVEAGKETNIRVIRRQLNKTGSDGSRTTITIQLGASEVVDGETVIYTINCGEDGEVIIKNLEWHKVQTTELTAPTAFEFDADEKKVTSVTDGNAVDKVSGYMLGLFESTAADAPVKTLSVIVGEAIDFSEVVGGTYHLKLKAVAKELPDVDSAWSTALGTPLVIQGSADTRIDITLTGNAGANNNPGEWAKYADGNTKNVVAQIDGNGDLHFKYSAIGTTDQPLKFMKKIANIAKDDTYTLSCKFIVPTGALSGVDKMSITVNGTIIEIHEGENAITVNSTQGTDPTIVFKFGYIDAETKAKIGLPALSGDAEYMIKDIVVKKTEAAA